MVSVVVAQPPAETDGSHVGVPTTLAPSLRAVTTSPLSPGTPEWIAAADEAVASVVIDAAARPPGGFVLRQVVLDEARRSWDVALDADASRVRVRPAGEEDATVTLTTDAATAAAIAGGLEAAPEAFLAGRLRIGGDTTALLAIQPVLAAIAPALAHL